MFPGELNLSGSMYVTRRLMQLGRMPCAPLRQGLASLARPSSVVHTLPRSPHPSFSRLSYSEAQAAEGTGRTSRESVPLSSAPSPCPTSPLRVFSAEASWDPTFVMAPERLVGLQNKEAARKEGLEQATRLAWRHIDGPEVRGTLESSFSTRSFRFPTVSSRTDCPHHYFFMYIYTDYNLRSGFKTPAAI